MGLPDPWNSRQISVPMIEQGHTCVEIRQGVATLSEPSKKLLELVAAGKLRHGGNPVLRWNASCLSTKENNDNLMFTKPERSKSSSRIDGIAATVNALAAAPSVTRIIFCCFSDDSARLHAQAMAQLGSPCAD